VRRHDLIEPGGGITCLVSGGPDSTCLWHVLRGLGYDVSAVHVSHSLRGGDSEAEAELRELRYAAPPRGLRATGHTASDQVETILYRLVSSGVASGMPVHRDDGVVRPLLCVWRDETAAYCREVGLLYRVDTSNDDSKRGLIRDQVLPLLRLLHPAADRNLLAAAEQERPLPRPVERALAELVSAREGSKRVDLGGGRTAVREFDRIWLERSAKRLDRSVSWGDWRIEPRMRGLAVRGWRPGDRLTGRREKQKVQDLFSRAKIPRSERESWPLVVRGDEVVAVLGVATAPGYEDAVVAWRESGDEDE
jgi:tRNA(Ile)-lysidine synthetase-like protein